MTKIVDHFGPYEFNKSFKHDSFCLNFETTGNILFYRRINTLSNSIFETLVPAENLQKILIQPSEPSFTDFAKTHLFLKFQTPLSLRPDSSIFGFSLFPIAISIFFDSGGNWFLLDTFFTKPEKYALYGNPHNGFICHFKKTNFSSTEPNEFDNFNEGILRLEIINATKSFLKLHHIILDYSSIKLYYEGIHCFAESRIRLLSPSTAETEFITPDVPTSYSQSINLLLTGFLTSSKFLMEFGI